MTSFTSKNIIGCTLLAITLLTGGVAHAANATDTWAGSSSSTNWNQATWTGGNATPISGDAFIFTNVNASSSTTLTDTLAAAFNVNGITYNSGALAYTMTGNAITLTNTVTNNSTNTEAINNAIAMTATRTFAANTGNISLGGVVSGAGGITKTGAGTLTLTGVDTFTGAITVNGGSLTIGGAGDLNNGNYGGTITLASGTSLIYDSTKAQILSKPITGAGSLELDSNITLTLSGNSGYTGNTTINQGTLLVSGAGFLATGTATSTISIASGATLEFASSHPQSIGDVIAGSGSLIFNGNTSAWVQLQTASTFTGATFLNSTELIFNGGSLAHSNLVLGGDAVLLANSATASAVNNLTVNAGLVATVENTGTATLSLGAITRGANAGMVDFLNTSTGSITTTTGNTNGILGTWAYFGNDSNLNYATATGNTIGAVVNTVDISGTFSSVTDATGNYSTFAPDNENSDAITANTLRFGVTGAATWENDGGAKLNGLMNAGSGSLTVTGGTITAGTPGGELDIVTNTQALTIGSVIADNTSASSVVVGSVGDIGAALSTPAGGIITFTGVNTYTGSTTINNGTLVIDGAGQLGAGAYAGNILDDGTLIYNSTAAQTFSGQISGTGSLSVTGTGILTLTNASNSLGGSIIVGDGSTLQASGSSATSFSAFSLIFTGDGSVTAGDGAATFTLSSAVANNTGGFIQVNSGATGTIGEGVTISNVPGSNININGGGTLDVYGRINVFNTLSVNNATLNLYGIYTGAYLETASVQTAGVNDFINVIDGGTVTLANALIIGNGAGTDSTYSAVTIGNGGSITTAVGTKGYTTIEAGTNAGVSYLYLDTGGTLTTAFFNNVAAGTTLMQSALYFNGGTLKANENNTAFMPDLIGSSTSWAADKAGPNGLLGAGGVYIGGTNGVGGGTISPNGFAITIAQPLLSGNGIAGSTADGNTVGQTDGGLTVNGGGTLTLTGVSTYNGGTTITGPTTVISAVAGGIGASTGSLTINGGGIFNIDNVAQTVGAVDLGLTGTTTGSEITSTGGTQTLTANSVTVDGTGNVIDTSVNLAGNTTLDSNSALAVNGQVMGTMTIDSGATLSGTGTVNGATTLTGIGAVNFGTTGNINGTLGVTGGNWNGLGSVSGLVTSSSGTFNIGSSGNLTATSGVNVTGGSLADSGTVTGGVTVSGTGALSGTGFITGSVNYTSSTNSTFAGVIQDGASASTLTLNNSGTTLTLTNTNTYSGGTIISAGTLSLSSGGFSGTLGATTGALTVDGTLDLAGTAQTVGALTGSGLITNLAGIDATLTFGNGIASGTNTYGGSIQDGATGFITLIKTGAGTQILSGANQYSGSGSGIATTIDGGILQITDESNIGNADGYFNAIGFTPDIELGGGELLTTGSAPTLVEGVVLDSGTTNTLAAATGTTATYSGAITDMTNPGGPGALTVGDNNGNNGSVVLTGNNTYSGGTIIASGTLYANNATSSTGTGAVTVNNGGTLSGIGAIAPTGGHGISVLNGGTLAPGSGQSTPFGGTAGTVASPGLTISNGAPVTFNTGAKLTFALGANNSSSALVVGSSAVTFNNNVVTINDLVGGGLTLNQTYTLIDGTSMSQYTGLTTTGILTANGYLITGGLALLSDASGSNFFADWYGTSQLYLTTGGDIDIEVIPEPSTWAMMVGGLALLIVIQRRRNKQNQV